MIDFIKLRITDSELMRYVLNKDCLELAEKTQFKDFANDVKTKEVYKYNGTVFAFYIDRLEVFIKPHYLHNQNQHNGNDFGVSDCVSVISTFIKEFDLSDAKAEIMQIEFGINFLPNGIRKPDQIIAFAQYHGKNKYETGDLPYFKKFYSINVKNGQRQVNEFKIIKFYWKGNHFANLQEVHPDTIRFEVKSKKKTYINCLGIKYIEDLANEANYRRLADEINREFTNVLFLDFEVNTSRLSTNDSDKVKMYLSDYFWYQILQKANDRNAFVRHKKTYNNLLNKTCQNIHTTLSQIVQSKTDELIKIGANFSQKTPHRSAGQKSKIGADLTIIKDEICTSYCSVCGVDIAMQKKNSFLLSHTGLWYYYHNNRAVFEAVAGDYLSAKWRTYPIDQQIKEIAHNIRNYRNNLKIKKNKEFKKFQNQIKLNLYENT